jgi:hypothetical protein
MRYRLRDILGTAGLALLTEPKEDKPRERDTERRRKREPVAAVAGESTREHDQPAHSAD